MARSYVKVVALSVVFSLVFLGLGYLVLPMLGWNVGVRKHSESSFVFRPGGETTVDDTAEPLFPGLPHSSPDQAEVKNLVVLMADGLGFSHLVAARTALEGARGRLTVERFPIAGWHTTFSADGMYTDSAAGATALATGDRTTPGSLSVDSDGNPVRTLMEDAVAAGKSVGVVTDSYLWDASPSAWLSMSRAAATTTRSRGRWRPPESTWRSAKRGEKRTKPWRPACNLFGMPASISRWKPETSRDHGVTGNPGWLPCRPAPSPTPTSTPACWTWRVSRWTSSWPMTRASSSSWRPRRSTAAPTTAIWIA